MMDLVDVLNDLRLACDVWGSQVKFAKRYGLSPAYVSDCLRGRREPGEKILKALRLKKVVGYVNMCIFALLLSCGVAEAKEVVIEYQDFLKMLAMKQHTDKTNNKLSAENAVLVKLKDEQGAVISLQQEDIRACREIVKTHEQLGETEAQISKAVEAELRKGIATEKRLSRYKSESIVATGIIAAIVYLTRR